jgi:hypothetical protein
MKGEAEREWGAMPVWFEVSGGLGEPGKTNKEKS